jgi:2-polyprenyl-3-methyl-5-hydroxy-6-metoxy-1,4-benzoquinol methylase
VSPGFLHTRQPDLREVMDDPGCEPDMLRRTYAHFVPLNRMLAGWGRVYGRYIRPRLTGSSATLLDIGCGGGAVTHILSDLARRDGVDLQVTGIDPDDRAVAYARIHTRAEILQCTSADMVQTGRRFDFVISNHVLHHLDDAERDALLRDSEVLTRLFAVHNDIRRSAWGYGAFWIMGLAFPGSFIRRDGLVSIRRSFTCPELGAMLPDTWHCHRLPPFRLLAVHESSR